MVDQMAEPKIEGKYGSIFELYILDIRKLLGKY